MTRKKKKARLTVADLRAQIISRIDRAIGDALSTSSCDDESIHDVRRISKRTRAYLSLYSPYDESTATRASRLVRNAARELSPYRDQQIIPAAIESVTDRFPERFPPHAASLLTGVTGAATNRQDSASVCQPLDKSIRRVVKRLNKARRMVKTSDRFDQRRLDATALRPSYSQARKLVAAARQSVPGISAGKPDAAKPGVAQCELSEAFHSLRKAVKLHYYQCQFISTVNKPLLKPRAKAVRDLGEMLGAAQDIAVLEHAILTSPLDPSQQSQFLGACQQVASELRDQSIALACEQFFENTKDFLRSLE